MPDAIRQADEQERHMRGRLEARRHKTSKPRDLNGHRK